MPGKKDYIENVMNAFNAYTMEKIAYYPLTFVHSSLQDRWFRIDGAAASELMEEYQNALKR